MRKKQTLEKTQLGRTRFLGGIVGLAGLACVLTQAKAQLASDVQISDSGQKTGQKSPIQRGRILATDGEILAETVPTKMVQINYERTPRSPGFAADLAAATGISVAEIMRPVRDDQSQRFWRRSLTRTQLNAVQKVKEIWAADGLSISDYTERVYPLEEITSGVVGRFREEATLSGVESAADADLATEGIRRRTGKTVTLTLDVHLQRAADHALDRAIKSSGADAGAAIVMDPATGQILAMADGVAANSDDVSPPNPNYQIAWEPGSVIKPLTLAAALQDGVIGEGWSDGCGGAVMVSGKRIPCTHAHGTVDINGAIAKSCNGAAMKWAQAVGTQNMDSFWEKLDLYKPADLGLPSETSGRQTKDGNDLLRVSLQGFGQSMTLTPIRLATAFSMLANDGLLMKPQLVRRIDNHEIAPTTVRRVVDTEVAHRVMQSMEGVFEPGGTGQALKIDGVKLAGKTGTAQAIGRVKDGHNVYVANFVGFVPADNPRAVVVVMLDNPDYGNHHGGQAAGPAFREIAEAILRIPAQRSADDSPADLQISVERDGTIQP